VEEIEAGDGEAERGTGESVEGDFFLDHENSYQGPSLILVLRATVL